MCCGRTGGGWEQGGEGSEQLSPLMSQEDVVLPRPQDGSYVSVLCELLGDIQSFASASSMAGYLFLRLEWRLHNLFKVSQGRPELVGWQSGVGVGDGGEKQVPHEGSVVE